LYGWINIQDGISTGEQMSAPCKNHGWTNVWDSYNVVTYIIHVHVYILSWASAIYNVTESIWLHDINVLLKTTF